MPTRPTLLLTFVLTTIATSTALATPLGTAFTYQGQLSQSGVLENGSVNLRFRLRDGAGAGVPPVGGVQVGLIQILKDVALSEGLFSVLASP